MHSRDLQHGGTFATPNTGPMLLGYKFGLLYRGAHTVPTAPTGRPVTKAKICKRLGRSRL
jgi:hypothetical protein